MRYPTSPMDRALAATFRLACALLAGAQLFFAAVAAQVVFPAEVAALPRADPRRQLAADLVGGMLVRLDAAALAGCALAVLCAVLLWRRAGGSLRPALFPLLAGACALASTLGTTPAIQAMRAAGQTAGPQFGKLHALSSSLLVFEVILLLAAFARAPQAPTPPTSPPSPATR